MRTRESRLYRYLDSRFSPIQELVEEIPDVSSLHQKIDAIAVHLHQASSGPGLAALSRHADEHSQLLRSVKASVQAQENREIERLQALSQEAAKRDGDLLRVLRAQDEKISRLERLLVALVSHQDSLLPSSILPRDRAVYPWEYENEQAYQDLRSQALQIDDLVQDETKTLQSQRARLEEQMRLLLSQPRFDSPQEQREWFRLHTPAVTFFDSRCPRSSSPAPEDEVTPFRDEVLPENEVLPLKNEVLPSFFSSPPRSEESEGV